MPTSVLSDIKVLDLSRLLPGSLCTVALADLGAKVTKVEAPPEGDYARVREPFLDSAEETSASASFIGLNRNKESIVLDLKHLDGPDLLLQLVARADVVVESFRPGVLERLGVGYAAMQEVNPSIVLCSITGWGQTGPLAQAAGHDINYLASVGLLSLTGEPNEVPVIPSILSADSAGGLFSAFAIMAALHSRNRTGLGQHIDVSMAHAVLWMASMTVSATLATGLVTPRDEAPLSGGAVCYQAYPCSDGWVAIGALEEKFWATWCRGVNRADLIEHRYDSPSSNTYKEVAAIFAERSRNEWAEFAEAYDCCLCVVDGLSEALQSPTSRHRGVVKPVAQPHVRGTVEALTLPFTMSDNPDGPALNSAPALGEHTRKELDEIGFGSSQIARLISGGAVS